MKVTYIIGAMGNPLYQGDFFDRGVYKTFGQHSFIYDLVVGMQNQGVTIDILVDDLNSFPLANIFLELGISVTRYLYKEIVSSDLILIDGTSSNILLDVYLKGLVVGIVHNHLHQHSPLFYRRCKIIMCMTKHARKIQGAYVNENKVVVITQGIDLERFKPVCAARRNRKVLIYSRMDKHKGSIYIPIVERLIKRGFEISVLGDGVNYRLMKNAFCEGVAFHEHCPCWRIHDFTKDFDVIVSNGRGVMEGMASGKVTIAAGVEYGGLVDTSNVSFLFERNFTGSNQKDARITVEEDIDRGMNHSMAYYRGIAEELFDVKHCINALFALL
ncbi:hypothetical protein [Dyadobacter sp. 32]|uniref:hypothetical protein n=1 Tax=Dyadobacter sp. 32 TaxID=538966 RepID=UPI0039C5E6F8